MQQGELLGSLAIWTLGAVLLIAIVYFIWFQRKKHQAENANRAGRPADPPP